MTGAPERLARFDLRQIRRDEQRHANARRRELAHAAAPRVPRRAATSSPPSVVISARFSGTRQQSCGRTPTAISTISSVSRHLEVHARLQQRPQRVHVAILDVPAVFAQVQRDVVGAGLLGQQRGMHRDRDTTRARAWRTVAT